MSVLSRLRGVPFLALGLALLANPLYLESLVCHSCGGWDLTPLFFAVATAVGVACLLSGLLTVAFRLEYRDRVYLVLGIAWAVLASVALYEAALSPQFAAGETRLFGYGHRTTVVAAVVAGAFLAGVALPRRSAGLALAGALLPIPFVAFAGLGSVVSPLLVAFSSQLLGIPFLGGLGFLAAALAGVSYGVGSGDPDPAPEPPTATRPDPD